MKLGRISLTFSFSIRHEICSEEKGIYHLELAYMQSTSKMQKKIGRHLTFTLNPEKVVQVLYLQTQGLCMHQAHGIQQTKWCPTKRTNHSDPHSHLFGTILPDAGLWHIRVLEDLGSRWLFQRLYMI